MALPENRAEYSTAWPMFFKPFGNLCYRWMVDPALRGELVDYDAGQLRVAASGKARKIDCKRGKSPFPIRAILCGSVRPEVENSTNTLTSFLCSTPARSTP